MGIPEITESEMAALREQARVGGLHFEAYLPPRLADWLLNHIERRTFRDPSEAVFVLFGEQQELEPHGDLRHEFSIADCRRELTPVPTSLVSYSSTRRNYTHVPCG